MRVLLVIVVILSTTWRVSAEEIDCTTTYKLSEMSKEYYNTYCNRKMFCQCFTTGCPKEFSKDIIEGLAKFWYFNNEQLLIYFLCDQVDFEMSPTMDKQFLRVITSNITDPKTKNISVPFRKRGYVQFPISSYFAPTVNTKGMLEIKLFITNPVLVYHNQMLRNHKIYDTNEQQLDLHYSWSQVNENNFYPTSIEVSFSNSSNSAESIENLSFGPFGGRGTSNEISFQFNKYTDLNKQSGRDFYMTVKAIDLGKDYSSTTNNKISGIRYVALHYICLGRKINPITNRTHWTGEGCRPVPYHNNKYERQILGSTHERYCHCDFKSLGLNYVDIVDKPQVPGFESPEPVDKLRRPATKTINPSATTKFTVIFCSILLAIAVLSVLVFGTFFVCCKFIK